MIKIARRITTEEEIERLIERVNTFGRGTITDRETFNKVYDEYLGEDLSAKQDKQLRKDVFSGLRAKFPEKISEERIRRIEKPVKAVPKKDFSQVGKVKGKVVFGRIAVFKIKGKPVTRFRDKKGHFISIKKK